MKRSLKNIVIAIIAIATLGLGSCAHQNKVGKSNKRGKQESTIVAKKPSEGAKSEKQKKQAKPEKKSEDTPKQKKEKLQFISVDEIKGNFKDGFKLLVTIENNTAFNLRVTSAEVHLSHDGHKIGRIVLSEEVRIPRSCRSQIEVPLRVSVSTSLATLSAINNLRKGIFSNWTLDANATIVTALGKVSFEENNVPLDTIIKHIDLSKFINKESLSKMTATPISSVKSFANKSIDSVKNFTDKSIDSVKSFTEKSIDSVKNFTDKNIEYITNFVKQIYLKFK
jgi:hypothetical protein